MKTRAKKTATANGNDNDQDKPNNSTASTLDPSITNPPQVFVLPKNLSVDSRILTLPKPATTTPCRYLLCPEKGSYEFTRVGPPKKACKSWLLAPEHGDASEKDTDEGNQVNGGDSNDDREGYILEKPDLMLATPIDPLFLVLPYLLGSDQPSSNMYLAASDHLDKLEEKSKQFQQMMRGKGSIKLRQLFEMRISATSDSVEAGDEKLYKFSRSKLIAELSGKAERMVAHGLPASMEEHFVKQALSVPVLSIKREDSKLEDMVQDENAIEGAKQEKTSQDNASAGELAGIKPPSLEPTERVIKLLRLRTALAFLLTSYLPTSLKLEPSSFTLETTNVDFGPLDEHLTRLADRKEEARALRSLSDNISRKRSGMDDEEALEKADAKKRKKEEEELKKKNTSRGVQQLAKANTTGMRKMSSFFTKKS